MPEFISNFFYLIEHTPPDQIANFVYYWVSPFLIFSVCVWGFSELWLDRRQEKFVGSLKWMVLQVSVPKDTVQTPKGIENFFTALSGAKSGITFKEKWIDGKINVWFSFEIVSMGGRVGYYIRALEKYRDYIESAFYAQYPEAQFTVVEDYANQIPTDFPSEDHDLWGSELVLKKDQFLPIRTWESFEHTGEKDARFKDPLLNILEALGTMKEGESFCIQLIIRPPDDQDWVKAGQKYIDKIFGKPEPAPKKGFVEENIMWLPAGFLQQTIGVALGAGSESAKQDDFKAFKITPFEKDVLDAVNHKISKIGWQAKIRFVYYARKELMRKGTVAPMAKGLFAQFTHQSLNALGLTATCTPLDDYPWQAWAMPGRQTRLANRYKNRSFGAGATPKIMNVEELATIWHFPSADARTPVLTTVGSKQAEAPVELGFALSSTPLMQNMNRSNEDGLGKPKLPDRKPLSVPKIRATYQGGSGPIANTNVQKTENNPIPTLPTMPKEEQMYVPKIGMPAPLPPGLDISDQPVPDDYYELPSNK